MPSHVIEFDVVLMISQLSSLGWSRGSLLPGTPERRGKKRLQILLVLQGETVGTGERLSTLHHELELVVSS